MVLSSNTWMLTAPLWHNGDLSGRLQQSEPDTRPTETILILFLIWIDDVWIWTSVRDLKSHLHFYIYALTETYTTRINHQATQKNSYSLTLQIYSLTLTSSMCKRAVDTESGAQNKHQTQTLEEILLPTAQHMAATQSQFTQQREDLSKLEKKSIYQISHQIIGVWGGTANP